MENRSDAEKSFAEIYREELDKMAREEVKDGHPNGLGFDYSQDYVEWLPIDYLQSYPTSRHPFRAASPERLEELKESIEENGILNPIIVWCRVDGEHIILAGHNRRMAARQLGWPKVPCIVKYDLSESEAESMMLADNLQQREDLLPSERAKAYKMRLDARRRQGFRRDLTSGQVGQKLSRDELSDTDSGRQVQRFIRLNYLIPELLDKVDTNALGIVNAEQLSFLSRSGQKVVYTYFFVDKPRGRLDKKLIQELRRLDANPDKGLDPNVIDALFLAREESRSFRQVKVPMKTIRHFFPPDITEQEVVDRLLEITESYFGG